MPSPTEQLFESLTKRQFSKTLELLKNDSDLVNAVDPKTGLSFFKYTAGRARTEEIIKYVVTHEKFDLQFTDKKGTNLDHMIRLGLYDLISQFVGNSKIIYNHGDLTYKTAVEILENAKTEYQEEASSSDDSFHQKFIEKIKQAVSHIRDITILYALKHDDAALMQKLDDAGGNCTDTFGTLGNKKLPTMLLTPQNTNIKAMLSQQVDEELKNLSRNRNTYFNSVNHLIHEKKKENAIEHKFQDKTIQSAQKKSDDSKEILDETINTVKRH